MTLTQVKSDGSIDTGFSNGGIRVLPEIGPGLVTSLMPASGNKSVVATSTSLIRIGADGATDQAFGQNGEVTDIPGTLFGSKPVKGAATQPDGKIVVAGGSSDEGIVLARFTADGQLDESFGGGGVVEPIVPPTVTLRESRMMIGFDGSDRIVVAGIGPDGPVVMKLLPEGSLDLSFGQADDGFSVPPESGTAPDFFGLVAINVDADGRFRLYGRGDWPGIGRPTNLGYDFDADGALTGPERVYGGQGSGVLTETADGGLASAGLVRYPTFTVDKVNRLAPSVTEFRTTFTNLTPDEADVSPGEAGVTGLTYQPADNSLIATGYANDPECEGRCGFTPLGVVAKIDAQTGNPVAGFGEGGAVLIPRNECPVGVGPSSADSPWNRCFLGSPKVRAKAKFERGASRRPALAGSVRLSAAPVRPLFVRRKAVITLPHRLKLRHGAKGLLRAGATSSVPGQTSASLEGRKIVLSFMPDPTDSGFYPTALNAPVVFKWRLLPGALKPIPRKLRHKSLHFGIRAAFQPRPESQRWYAGNGTSKHIKARPVN